jgi:hypothetical protein
LSRPCSAIGQSVCLRSKRLQIRILPGALTTTYSKNHFFDIKSYAFYIKKVIF